MRKNYFFSVERGNVVVKLKISMLRTQRYGNQIILVCIFQLYYLLAHFIKTTRATIKLCYQSQQILKCLIFLLYSKKNVVTVIAKI